MNRAILGAQRERWDRVRQEWQPGTDATRLNRAHEMLDLIDALLEDDAPTSRIGHASLRVEVMPRTHEEGAASLVALARRFGIMVWSKANDTQMFASPEDTVEEVVRRFRIMQNRDEEPTGLVWSCCGRPARGASCAHCSPYANWSA